MYYNTVTAENLIGKNIFGKLNNVSILTKLHFMMPVTHGAHTNHAWITFQNFRWCQKAQW